MNFKEIFYKFIDFIDIHRKKILIFSLSVLATIVLIIVLTVSSDEFSVEKETSILLKNIEQRKYSMAIENYENYKNEFSTSKMSRFNKSISGKINKLLVESGDKYVNNEITKEHYIGIINTINALGTIEIDVTRIVEQSKRISEMYEQEHIDYDVCLSYLTTVSTLKGIINELDVYIHKVKEIYDSREVYEQGVNKQSKSMYYEAIIDYDKVLQSDKSYYEQAQKNKKRCIEDMYDYYIQKIDESDQSGNYEQALEYVHYVKKYYPEDENILKLEKEYNKKLSMYTLSSEEIINILCKKMGKNKERISITSFYQMVDKEKYYYVEVFEYGTLIDEVIISAKTKKVYSYKDSNKDYDTTYADGYFKINVDGEIQFAISEEKGKFVVENKLEDENIKYKTISKSSKEKLYNHMKDKEEINNILGNSENLYYYYVVNKGFLKNKEVYIVNIYNERIYNVSK